MTTDYSETLSPLLGWENNGRKETASGAILLGHCPHVAPEAWLHIIFAPLDSEGLGAIQTQLGENGLPGSIPDAYSEFLRVSNGLSLYSGSLALYGHRTSWERTGDDVWHPFDLASHAREHMRSFQRSETIPDSERFFIGSYKSDGSAVYIETSTGKVCHVGRGTDVVDFSWSDFATFLKGEINRLSDHFDESGKRKDRKIPTTPV